MLSTVDHRVSPPRIELPTVYNAAHDLVARNLLAGRGDKCAYIDDQGSYTYAELAARVDRVANALRALGLRPEQRVLLALLDTIDFPSVFLGAITAGLVPIAVNTMLTPDDYAYLLADSRASALVVSAPLLSAFARGDTAATLAHVIVSGGDGTWPGRAVHRMDALMAAAAPQAEPFAASPDDICFWLYSSGSTGRPKGTVHLHGSLVHTAELYARPILGLDARDVVFSAAKLFFAYGLGNALTFPLAVGATAILMAERVTPEAVFRRLREHRPSVFYGVPTLYAGMLASPELPPRDALALRLCTSAGEALPAEIGERFTRHFGVEVLDGIGSTEMLHIFISNRAGNVRYGTTGRPVPGYDIRLVDEQGIEVGPGVLGELQIRGPSSALMYWNNRAQSRVTFLGPWTRAGDKYTRDADGLYIYGGRSDDMLKVSGQYVSPFEVEAALLTHAAVLEAAVIGINDADGLTRTHAVIVTQAGVAGDDTLARELQQHVRTRLAPHKYPRTIVFVAELPKTATGKIQRFRLRQQYAQP
jgi:benzoate-CoA ligase